MTKIDLSWKTIFAGLLGTLILKPRSEAEYIEIDFGNKNKDKNQNE